MENLTPERMVEIKSILRELQVSAGNQSLIQNNKILFVYKDINYRCKMPNQKEQNEAEQWQNKYKIKLVQEDGTITRKKLIQVLKEKQNIDIPELYKEKEKVLKELQDVLLELSIITSDNKSEIEIVKKKKNKAEEKLMELTIEIIEMLAPCIEEQIKSQYYKYLAYACTEKQIEDKEEFELIWKNFDEFEQDDTGLSYKAIDSIQTLLLNLQE